MRKQAPKTPESTNEERRRYQRQLVNHPGRTHPGRNAAQGGPGADHEARRQYQRYLVNHPARTHPGRSNTPNESNTEGDRTPPSVQRFQLRRSFGQ